MKFRKVFFSYILYYFSGNICFNMVFAITKTTFINQLGAKESLGNNLLFSFRETFVFYTFLFMILLIANITYKKYTITQLNQRLNKIKKGGDHYEK